MGPLTISVQLHMHFIIPLLHDSLILYSVMYAHFSLITNPVKIII